MGPKDEHLIQRETTFEMAQRRDDKPSEKAKAKKPAARWICVVEVNDRAGPRRSLLYPQLKLLKSVTPPGPALVERLARKGVYEPGDFVGLREDLMPAPEVLGGRDNPAVSSDAEKAFDGAYNALRRKLEALGYTVNRRTVAVYRMYVCGLEQGCIRRRKKSPRGERGDLYVGETAKTVAERLAEHHPGQAGSEGSQERSNRYVREHFTGLRQDLIPAAFPEMLFCREHSLRAESLLRLWLEGEGYTLEGGKDRYGDMQRVVAASGFEAVMQAWETWPHQLPPKPARQKRLQ